MMGTRVIGIQLQGALKFPTAARPIPVIQELHFRKSSMGLAEAVVDLQRLGRCRLRAGKGLTGRDIRHAEGAQRDVSISESGISEGIAGVPVNGLLEILDGLRVFRRR